jgi:hypothetical protein
VEIKKCDEAAYDGFREIIRLQVVDLTLEWTEDSTAFPSELESVIQKTNKSEAVKKYEFSHRFHRYTQI